MKNLVYLFLISASVLFSTSCKSPNSITKSNDNSISDFHFQNIEIKGKGEIFVSVTQGDKDLLSVDATEEQLDLLTIINEKNKLTIIGDKELEMIAKDIYIDIEIRELKSIKIKKGNNNGVKASDNKVYFDFTNKISGDSLEIYGEGKSEFAGILNYDFIKLHHQGILNCEFEGSAKYLDLHVEGIAKIDAKDLLVEDGNVHSEGISRINVNMLNDANVSAEGIHLIKYNDNPNIKFKREGIVLRQVD